MEDRSRRRRAGSLVIPFVLIVVGVLLLLDNLNVVDVDWATVWKLWPLLLIAIGLEIVLGRRVSGAAVLVLVVIVIIGGATLWWSQIVGTGDRSVETITWPMDGVERAQVELDVVVGELLVAGQSDMSDLLTAHLDLAPGIEVNDRYRVSGDVARGSIVAEKAFFAVSQLFGEKASRWDMQLNARTRWELEVSSAIGDVDLDLTDLRVDSLQLNSVAGSIEVEMPEQGGIRATIDGGAGDIRVTIPPEAQARVRVNEGIGDVNVSRRFEQRGDYYQTEGFSGAESQIVLEIDHAIGSVVIR